MGSALVRQAVVLTFQNLRYLFDSCTPILDKGFRLLDKGLVAVLTTNRSTGPRCSGFAPREKGWRISSPRCHREACVPRFRVEQVGEGDRRHATPVGLFLFFAGRVIRIWSYPTPGLCLLSLPLRAEPQER